MGKINFTKEDQDRLNSLSLEALQSNLTFKGHMATELTIHDLYHNVQTPSLEKMLSSLTKEKESGAKVNKWQQNDYEKRKQKELGEKCDLIELLIGYKLLQKEKDANKSKLDELRLKQKQLIDENKTPTERLAELEKEIAETAANL